MPVWRYQYRLYIDSFLCELTFIDFALTVLPYTVQRRDSTHTTDTGPVLKTIHIDKFIEKKSDIFSTETTKYKCNW